MLLLWDGHWFSSTTSGRRKRKVAHRRDIMTRKLFWLATGTEIIGISVISVGIGLEVALGGAVFLYLISMGSVLVAGGGLLFAKFLKR